MATAQQQIRFTLTFSDNGVGYAPTLLGKGE